MTEDNRLEIIDFIRTIATKLLASGIDDDDDDDDGYAAADDAAADDDDDDAKVVLA